MGPENLPLRPRDSLLVPAHMELEGESIVWDWDYSGEPGKDSPDSLQEDCENVLGAFTALAGAEHTSRADPEKVFEFAQEYGPLYLCESHGLPLPCASDRFRKRLSPNEKASTLTEAVRVAQNEVRLEELGVFPSEPDGSDSPARRSGQCMPSRREPVERWLYWAERVQAVLEIGTKLRDGERIREVDIEPLIRVTPGGYLAALRRQVIDLPYTEEEPVPIGRPQANTPEQQRQRFQEELQDLLQMSGLQVTLEYLDQEADLVRLRWDGVGVFSRIVADLVRGLHDEKTTICHECGRVFQPEGRKRPAGQNHYCSDECQARRSKHIKRRTRASDDSGS